MAQFVGCLRGMGEACRALDFPIISGNVSLYNESKATGGGSAILPTPAIGGVGLLQDWSASATIGGYRDGDDIWLIGTPPSHLGQSLWLREIHGRGEGAPPPVDLATERRHAEFVRRAIADGQLTAVHDISDGGLLIALAEMALAGGRGARLDRTFLQSAPLAGLLFGEDQGRYLVTTSNSDPVVRAMADNAIAHSFVGSIAGDSIDLRTGTVSLTDLRTAHESFFPKLMGPDAALA
jgi:phosphoribosylformylglycinamidine synthase